MESKEENKEESMHSKKETHKKVSGLKVLSILLTIMTVLVIINLALTIAVNNKISTSGIKKTTSVKKTATSAKLDFYVMSYCPYGNQAEEAIEPVYQKLKDSGLVEFNPHYVIYSNYRGGGPQFCLDPGSKYCSMHGIQEMNQDVRELCVAKNIGMDEYFEFVLAMNKRCTSQNADSCWQAVAEEIGLDVDAVSACEKDEGLELAQAELDLNNKFGVQGSPTVLLNDKPYQGQRTPQAYLDAICKELGTNAPDECKETLIATTTSAPTAGGCE